MVPKIWAKRLLKAVSVQSSCSTILIGIPVLIQHQTIPFFSKLNIRIVKNDIIIWVFAETRLCVMNQKVYKYCSFSCLRCLLPSPHFFDFLISLTLFLKETDNVMCWKQHSTEFLPWDTHSAVTTPFPGRSQGLFTNKHVQVL